MKRSRFAVLLVAMLASCRGSDSLVIEHVTLIDVVAGERRPDVSVVIREGKIVDVLAASPKSRGTVVDGRGKFLIPGLWDRHAHLWDPDRELPLLVANGVLGARDVGGVPKAIFDLREQVRNGRLGPEIIACGPIVDGAQPTNPRMSIAVHDAKEGRAAVQSLKAMGADCVKVHDGLSRDAYFAIAGEAKKLGLPLVGHIPVAVPTFDAPRAGQRTIEHQIGLRGCSNAEADVLQFEATHDIMAEAMSSGNFSLIPENIARKGTRILEGFDAQLAGEYRAFAANGTCVDPTLVTQYALTYIDDLAARDDPRLKYIPASTKVSWLPSEGMLTRYRTPAYIAYRKRELANLRADPGRQRAGVTFLAGSNMSIPYVFPGFAVHDELGLFVQAGLTPAEALRTATINPARVLGIEASAGSVERGKRADLVLLDADPLVNIANTKAVRAVIVRGKLVDRAALDRLLADAERLATLK